MLLTRIVAVILPALVVAPSLAAAQQTPNQPSSRLVDGGDVRGGVAPWRMVRTTSRAGGRDTITEGEQVAGPDGRLAPSRDTQVEVIRAGSVVRTSAETYGYGLSGERYLREIRDSVENSSAGGRMERTDTTRRIDLHGQPAVREYTTEVTSATADGRQSARTTQRPDLDGRLRPQERTEQVERRAGPAGVRTTSTELHTDLDSRWLVTEVRNRDERRTGATVETEETIQQTDLNGRLSERERRISRLTAANGVEELLVETFTDEGGRYQSRPDSHRTLTERIRRITTLQPDGGRQVIEEIEERSLVTPEDPLRLIRRVVSTFRPTGTGRWRMERQVFQRDLNNRLVPTAFETGESTEP